MCCCEGGILIISCLVQAVGDCVTLLWFFYIICIIFIQFSAIIGKGEYVTMLLNNTFRGRILLLFYRLRCIEIDRQGQLNPARIMIKKSMKTRGSNSGRFSFELKISVVNSPHKFLIFILFIISPPSQKHLNWDYYSNFQLKILKTVTKQIVELHSSPQPFPSGLVFSPLFSAHTVDCPPHRKSFHSFVLCAVWFLLLTINRWRVIFAAFPLLVFPISSSPIHINTQNTGKTSWFHYRFFTALNSFLSSSPPSFSLFFMVARISLLFLTIRKFGAFHSVVPREKRCLLRFSLNWGKKWIAMKLFLGFRINIFTKSFEFQ